MKTKLFKFLVLFAILTPTVIFAQEVIESGTEAINFWDIVLGYAKFVFLGMLITAANHLVAGTFEGKLWLKTTFLPGLITYVGGLAIAALDIYVTKWDWFVESIIGQSTDYTDYSNLAITGVILVSIIKGLFEVNKTKEKNAIRLSKNN